MPLFPTDGDPSVKAIFQIQMFGPLVDLDLQRDLHAILSSEGMPMVTAPARPLEAAGQVSIIEVAITNRSVLDLVDLTRRNLPRGVLIDMMIIVEAPSDDPTEQRYRDIPVNGDPLPGLI